MKIVIEVSEKDYLDFMLQYDNGILDEKTPSHRAKIAIANGTPLPKGHGALKDIDAIIAEHAMTKFDWNDCVDVDDLRNAPTIIEADEEGSEEG